LADMRLVNIIDIFPVPPVTQWVVN